MAVSSGIVYTEYRKSSRFYVSWEVYAAYPADNCTRIEWQAGVEVGGGNQWYTNAIKLYDVVIDGRSFGGAVRSNITANGSYEMMHGIKDIYHDSAGNATFNISLSGGFYGQSDTSGAGSFTLPKIAQATIPTLSATSVDVGGQVTINMANVAGIVHELYFKRDIQSFEEIRKGVEASYTWTVPKDIANTFPKTTKGTISIVCRTMRGTERVGEDQEINLEVKIPNTEEFQPTINSVSISEAVTAIKNAFGVYAQGLSKLKVAISASGKYGASLSYKTVIEKNPYLESSFTSAIVLASGTVPVTVTVTDSRGYISKKTVNVTVFAYTPPAISVTCIKCNADGTANENGSSTKVTVKGSVSSIVASGSQKNTIKVTLTKRESSSTSATNVAINVTQFNFEQSVIVNNTPPDKTYEFVATVADKIMSIEAKAATGKLIVSFYAGGKGVHFFREAEAEGFWVDGRNIFGEIDGKVQSGGVTGEDGGHKMALSWNGSRVIVGIDNNAAVKTLLDTSIVIDYIIGHHISGGWEYIKWASGRVEAWRRWTSTNLATSGMQGGFYYRIYALTLPSGLFKSITDAHADCHWGTGTSWASARNVTTEAFEGIYYSNQNGGAGTFYNYVRGKWK